MFDVFSLPYLMGGGGRRLFGYYKRKLEKVGKHWATSTILESTGTQRFLVVLCLIFVLVFWRINTLFIFPRSLINKDPLLDLLQTIPLCSLALYVSYFLQSLGARNKYLLLKNYYKLISCRFWIAATIEHNIPLPLMSKLKYFLEEANFFLNTVYINHANCILEFSIHKFLYKRCFVWIILILSLSDYDNIYKQYLQTYE